MPKKPDAYDYCETCRILYNLCIDKKDIDYYHQTGNIEVLPPKAREVLRNYWKARGIRKNHEE